MGAFWRLKGRQRETAQFGGSSIWRKPNGEGINRLKFPAPGRLCWFPVAEMRLEARFRGHSALGPLGASFALQTVGFPGSTSEQVVLLNCFRLLHVFCPRFSGGSKSQVEERYAFLLPNSTFPTHVSHAPFTMEKTL